MFLVRSERTGSRHCLARLALSLAFLCAGIATAVTAVAGEERDPAEVLRGIDWVRGPGTGKLGDVAKLEIPEGYLFADKAGVKKFLEVTHNPPSDSELGVLLPADSASWFVIFEFNHIGYVKDDDKDKLDAEKLLSSIREGTEEANKERKKHGWTPLEIVGWYQEPAYDATSHNLVWAIRGRSEGSDVINHSTRILGRKGVMQADLVAAPEEMNTAVPSFNTVLSGFTYIPGERYAEYRNGDKIAKYGLSALIVGGAAVAAAKSGLLAKFGKAIVLLVMGAFAAIARWFKALFAGKQNQGDTGTPT